MIQRARFSVAFANDISTVFKATDNAEVRVVDDKMFVVSYDLNCLVHFLGEGFVRLYDSTDINMDFYKTTNYKYFSVYATKNPYKKLRELLDEIRKKD